jgi:hypothetical protein
MVTGEHVEDRRETFDRIGCAADRIVAADLPSRSGRSGNARAAWPEASLASTGDTSAIAEALGDASQCSRCFGHSEPCGACVAVAGDPRPEEFVVGAAGSGVLVKGTRRCSCGQVTGPIAPAGCCAS